MSHVDEGALHAYLDGALDEFPAAEAAEIRTHLDTCGECAVRLERERAVRAEAHAVLGLATPDIEMPTLEDLRAYVQRTRPPARSPSARMARMGWAASIVFAVGAGWMLRDGQLQLERFSPQTGAVDAGTFEARTRPASADDERQASELSETDLMEEIAREQTASTAAAAAESATPMAEPAEAFADGAVGRSPSPLGDAAARSRAGAAAGLTASPDVTASSGSIAAVAADDAAPVDPAGNRMSAAERADILVTAPSAPAAVTAERRSRELEPEVYALGLAGASMEAVTADPNEQAAGDEATEKADSRRADPLRPVTSAIDQGRLSRTMAAVDEDRLIDEEPALAVPGYDVVSVTNLGEGTTAVGAHVLQRFDGWTNFEIFHLEPGVDPAVVPASAEGDREVRVESEAGWVIVRGPLDDETLGVLLTLLFPG